MAELRAIRKRKRDSKSALLQQVRGLAREKLLHSLPIKHFQHVGHRVPFSIAEKGQRLKDMNLTVVRLGVFPTEKPQNFLKAEALGTKVEIYEIAPGATARDSAHFHASNVARISNGNAEKPVLWEQHRVGIAEKTNLRSLDGGVDGVRGFR